MDFFTKKPYPKEHRQEIEQLLLELYEIGRRDDFLSERPGYPFNAQCRHTRAREIGKRLNEIGGFTLMEYIARRVQKKLGSTLSSHLEFAWTEIGQWMG